MDYQKVQSTHEANAKQAYLNQAGAGCIGAQAGNSLKQDDPASLRGQQQALMMLLDRLNGQRNSLRDIADCVLGGEPECDARPQPPMPIVGGLTADIVTTFQALARVADEIDQQVRRLQRVSS